MAWQTLDPNDVMLNLLLVRCGIAEKKRRKKTLLTVCRVRAASMQCKHDDRVWSEQHNCAKIELHLSYLSAYYILVGSRCGRARFGDQRETRCYFNFSRLLLFTSRSRELCPSTVITTATYEDGAEKLHCFARFFFFCDFKREMKYDIISMNAHNAWSTFRVRSHSTATGRLTTA